ncbi:MAG: autotransporter outer membrane beta-barrel domain-containing protein [Synergistaceae bacterium]|nr:autotransporter outer membrane beta-barrel domain-containing protein [Synergistaceae bacterium]
MTGSFVANYVTFWGGAIYNEHGTVNVTGNFVGNHAMYGGAITNGGTLPYDKSATVNVTGDFVGNYVKPYNFSSSTYGGAISNGINGTMTIRGNFRNNFVSGGPGIDAAGGAIDNRGTIAILADDKDILFSGNTVLDSDKIDVGGAIYNSQQASVLKLYASDGNSISFEGRDGSTNADKIVDSVHNIGKLYINGNGSDETGYTGTVNFVAITDNATPSGQMYIYGGTVGISRDVTQSLLSINNATINMQDAAGAKPEDVRYSTITVTTLGGSGNLMIDATVKNDAAKNADKIVYTSVDHAATLTLTNINLREGFDSYTTETKDDYLTVLDGSGATLVVGDATSKKITTQLGDYLYTFENGTTPGKLKVTGKFNPLATLVDYITDTEVGHPIDTYSFAKSEILAKAITTGSAGGATQKTNYTLGMNGLSLTGTGTKHDGITVAEKHTLDISSTSAEMKGTISGFATALTVDTGGTLVIKNVNFSDNTTDISNAGTLNMSGTNSMNSGVANDGAMEVSSGSTTFASGVSVSGEGSLVNKGSLTIDADKLTLTGDVTNEGTLTFTGGTTEARAELGVTIKDSTTGTVAFGDGNANAYISNANALNQSAINVAAKADVTNTGKLTAKTLINAGTLSAAIDDLSVDTTFTNNGTLETSGELNKLSTLTNSGTVKIASGKTLKVTADKNLGGTLDMNGATLDMQETEGEASYSALTVVTLKGNGDLKINANVNESVKKADNISFEGIAGTTPVVNLASINLAEGFSTHATKSTPRIEKNWLTVLGGTGVTLATLKVGGTTGSITTQLGNYSYKFTTAGSEAGKLTVTETYNPITLTEYISGAEKAKDLTSYSFESDETLAAAVTTGATKTNYTIGMNGKDLKAGTGKNNGITVSNGRTLTIDGKNSAANNGTISGFGTALTVANGGTLAINNVNFSDNNIAISNAGTLNMSGTNSFDSKITGNGTATNAGTVTITANNLDIALQNDGTLNLGAGTLGLGKNISGTGATVISGVVKSNAEIANTITIDGAGQSLEISADNVAGEVTNSNQGTLILDGGKLAKQVSAATEGEMGTVNLKSATEIAAQINDQIIKATNGYSTVADASYITSDILTFNGGGFDFRNYGVEHYVVKNINLTGNGNLMLDVDLANKLMDTLNVAEGGAVTGSGKLHVTALTLLSDAKQNKTNIAFTTTDGLKGHVVSDVTHVASDMWKYLVAYDKETGEFAFTKNGRNEPDKPEVSETTKSVADTANAINLAWLETTGTLQKRLGDLRGGEASNTGWARFQRSNDDHNGARKLNVSGNLYQLGYDIALKNDTTARGYFGLSLERFDGSQSYKIGGGDVKSTSLSAYYTKIYDSGHYFDFIFRYGRYESDTTSYDAGLSTKLDYGMNGVTLSGEYGYRANIGKNGFYFEPQAEVIYGYLAGAKKTSSRGILADIDSTNHFVTRLGVALGKKVKNFNYYLRGSYYHDFAGSTNILYGDASYKQDSARNWWELSLGGGWNMTDASYFYAELTKHFKDVSNSINFNLGFRFTL